MSTPTMMLFTDVIPPSAPPVYLPGGARAIYLREGSAHLETDTTTQFLSAESGMVTEGQLTVRVGAEGATIWRWELVSPEQAQRSQALRSAPAATSELALSTEFDLDPRFRWLMRLDSVTFPPGGTAWTHNHQGPGVRICRNGEITIETEGTRNTYRPGEAWAEKGVLPVLAPTTPDESTTFIRCFLLPQHNRGVSSFRVVLPEDREKPNTQRYHVFSERLLDTVY
ncbi:cupin domain-containing protein [Salinibacterium sp. dk2585]|uniref:cupin domain-containing protein n=1 Tax=unclassified Salinibacterium TaxID=2632331 RepID=UPI0011C24C70|nr:MULTISPECIES: cupin domain-containing protein [unclassified Salinibacterium]QEE60246.1 cupin domain-containing protein [Salinibacterium sp. dk2585]TXK55318.1 cupin domain-containing protein [Salinibacterium sp. dk5596]